MTGALLLAGIGLFLLPVPDRARQRLLWLATHRLGRDAPAAQRSHRFIAPSARLRRPLLSGLAVLAGAVAGPVPAALAGLAAWTLTGCWRRLAAERSADQHRLDLAAAVTAIADEYAAGAGTGAAFDRAALVAGPFRAPLAEAGLRAGYGGEPADALTGAALLAPLAVACALVGRTGASLTQLLAGVRADLAADQASRRAVAAAVAGPRTSAMLLATLPVIGLAMGTGMGADPARVLLHSSIGLAALTTGVLLNLAGLVWTLRLTRMSAA